MEKLLTVKDVMVVLRISRPTLYRLLKGRKLQPVRIGSRTLFDANDIRAFIEGSKEGKEQVRREKAEDKPRPEKRASRKASRKTPEPEKSARKKAKTKEPKQPEDAKTEAADKQGRLL